MADALAALLAEAGCDIRVYGSAETFMASGPPVDGDVVVVDLGLPGISGRDVIRWLGGLAARPRVVVISGKAERDLTRELQGLAFDGVLRKPPSVNWLPEIVPDRTATP
ncbi:Transcriptional regulatory protein FixJ [Methylobrevis pamukkalensis]|uniref:Transcriptional regulatory protein FixJ n=1 Tax=Methylobrevis pamukkalensis TaxID=1439726 RepID=A0A1E3H7R3_9HYPH|nr:Transcriptional regulatory protein FixJ [Methylobrevis pamukkalensis]